MHVIIVTDAWYPHLSGVLRVVESLSSELDAQGVGHTIIHPQSFPGISLPGYSEVKLSFPIFFRKTVDNLIKEHDDVAIHIMTEGPLGLTMRNYCVARNLAFTTSFHTMWHKYLKTYFKIPSRLTMHYVREFHKPAARIIVPAANTKEEIEKYSFNNEITICVNGVDTAEFHPRPKSGALKRPHMLFVGRVSEEKNIEEFLKLPVEGSKRVVGDGPLREKLAKKYPEVEFTGPLRGEDLAQAYAEADVFVFPSKTDNFSVALLEAVASGVPIAGHVTPGQEILVTSPKIGTLDEDLEVATREALRHGDPEASVELAKQYSWPRIAETFISQLVPAGKPIKVHAMALEKTLTIPRHFYRLFTDAGYVRTLLFGFDKKR